MGTYYHTHSITAPMKTLTAPRTNKTHNNITHIRNMSRTITHPSTPRMHET